MVNNLEKLLADSSFMQWVKGEADEEQKKMWEEWLNENPNRQKLVQQAKEIANAVSSEYSVPDAFSELEELNRSIDKYESRQNQRKAFYGMGTSHKIVQRTSWYIAAAIFLAAVLLGIMIRFYYPESTKHIVQEPRIERYRTGFGEKLTFRLSDGSQITLNGNSSLTFSSTVKKGLNTEVWLEGEAYFEIARLEGDQTRTFKVQTNDGTVDVLGTRFVVNTFREETAAILVEGEVRISNAGTTAGYKLSPGQLARFKFNDNKIAIQEVDAGLYTSWVDDKLTFRNASMRDVAKRIEDIFGVEVLMADHLQQESLSGSIKSSNLEVLKEALEEILETEVVLQDQKLLIGLT